MKQIIISLLTLALADICLCSCGNDVAANTSLEEMHKKSSITQSDEKHKKAITDSINNLREKIMDLTEKYEKVYQELSEVKMDNKKINDEKQRIMVYSYWWRYWIAWFDSINFCIWKNREM